jgi:hypothetical protein
MAGRILWPIAAAVALAFAGSMFLMGMPGVFFLNLAGEMERFEGTYAESWNAIMRVSALAPLGVPPALWALWAIRPGARWVWTALAGAFGYVVGGSAAAYLA